MRFSCSDEELPLYIQFISKNNLKGEGCIQTKYGFDGYMFLWQLELLDEKDSCSQVDGNKGSKDGEGGKQIGTIITHASGK